MGKKQDTLLKKEDYVKLDEIRDKIQRSINLKTVSGYDRKELHNITSIYKKYGGNKNYNFTNCNSCAFRILNSVIKLMDQYDARYKKNK